MVFIETVNYTFFILKYFDTAFLIGFGIQAVIGLLSTHFFRFLLRKQALFQKPQPVIWALAAAYTVALSVLATLVFNLFYIPSGMDVYLETFSPVSFFGYVMNWCRYVGGWVIVYFLYKIMGQNSQIRQEKLLAENMAKSTELELLKTQLNPHFLFNALNSIKALVLIDPEKSRDAIVMLSELLRFTLSYGRKPFIPLGDELEETRKYLALECIRFGARLRTVFEIDENTLAKTVPPTLLLTLTENAIKHGIAKQAGAGHICLKTCLSDNVLIVETRNPGRFQPGERQGIGLKNIRHRLEEAYGHRASLQIEERGEEVVATLTIAYP